MEKHLLTSIVIILLILGSCREKANKGSLDEISKKKDSVLVNDLPALSLNLENNEVITLKGKKFYLLKEKPDKELFLNKNYFESEMEVYTFKANKFKDRTGSAIMEPLEYDVLKEINSGQYINLVIENWNNEKRKIRFEYNPTKGLLYKIKNNKRTMTFLDSLKINSFKIVYMVPCGEYTDEYEKKDCLEEYIKTEEERRVRANDFKWYPRLDCANIFDSEFCKKLNKIN